MNASKIEINGKNRIKLELPNNHEIASKLRQIEGAAWSHSLNGWHIPYDKESFSLLKKLFPEIEYPKKGNEKPTEEPVIAINPTATGSPARLIKNVTVQVIGRKIILKLPKNQIDIHFILSLRYSRWDGKQFFWVVPNYPGNLDLIRDYFKDRIYELIIHEDFEIKTSDDQQRKIKLNEVLIIRTTNGRLKLIFAFNKELGNLIKQMPFNSWDSKNKLWSIPYSEKLMFDLKTMIKAQGLEILYEEEEYKGGDKAKRVSPFEIPNYRTCPDQYIKKLKELRYSNKTLKTYKTLFEEYINYYPDLDIITIADEKIVAFLQYLVIKRKISTSYQNQSINAIKFYYERVLGRPRKVYFIDRPKPEKALPVVLNEEELTETFRQVKNIKHKAIIMLIYSSGLRLGELLSLKIKDIDSKRMQVFVRQAKDRKDRYTLLSKKVLPVLRQYFAEYKPGEWLFEGAKGQQYSESSVQAIVTGAFRKAGITKKASTHTLRHCFGTHLLEGGTDLRYIQALMGHASSKTTEIYTHVTTKGFDQIVNPLDKLDL